MVVWRNNYWHATTKKRGRGSRGRWYWHDNCGTRRFLGACRDRAVQKIATRGLPGRIQYVRSGNLHMLEVTPEQGWVHLTPLHCVINAYKQGRKYHISLIMDWELNYREDLREALDHVKSAFTDPRRGVLRVRKVQDNHVCVLSPDQELFCGCIYNIMYLRMCHPDALHFTLPEPSISM